MRGWQLGVLIWGLAALAGCGDGQRGQDYSSPRAAVTNLLSAIAAGDEQAVRRSFPAEEAQGYAEAMARLLAASKDVQTAARGVYGKDDAETLKGSAAPGSGDLRQFAEAQETIDGERATLTTADGQSLNLVREQGQWKVTAPPAGAAAAAVMRELAGGLEQLAQELRGGQWAGKDLKSLKIEITRRTQEALAHSASAG